MSRVSHILPLFMILLLNVQYVGAESYERVERRNLWNEGRNVTGIMRDSMTISYAELYYTSEQGDYRNFSDYSKGWSVGAEAKSITHFDKVSMIGSFSYDHTEGEEMSGSMFIAQNNYPFDILEFTPGDKRLQTYSMMGGITSALGRGWSIGVKGEFKAQNYVKYKDLRHYNYRMELALMPSVAYKLGEFTIGATYIYERNSETIRAQEVGSTAAAYYAFLDKGLMSGAYETWGGAGIHLNESGVDGFPVRENFNGGAVQLQWRGLYADVEYRRGLGEVGEKQTYWFEFPSSHYTARLGYSIKSGSKVHLFNTEANYSTLTNNENVLGSVSENGVTSTVIYGSNEIFSTTELSIKGRYDLMFMEGGNLYIGLDQYHQQSTATQMYPYVDELKTSYYQLYVGGVYPIKEWELRAKLLYSTGSIADDSYTVSSDVDAGDKPTHLEEYYNIENEYLTSTRVVSSLSIRYNLPREFYCQADINYTQAFDIKYIEGSSRWGYGFRLGYKF